MTPAHETQIEALHGGHGGWQSWCSCGWVSDRIDGSQLAMRLCLAHCLEQETPELLRVRA